MKILTTNQIQTVISELRNNKVLIMPTDTVWGIIALNEQIIYKIKKRPLSKKIVKFINSISQISHLPIFMQDVIKKYWPGQLTIIYQQISYRIPKNPFILALLKILPVVYCSSANITNKKPLSSIAEIEQIFKPNLNDIIAIEPSQNWQYSSFPSTIIDLDRMNVIRQGQIDGQKIINEIKMKGTK
jgi:L-threonylcarbamoyladenylate synthase